MNREAVRKILTEDFRMRKMSSKMQARMSTDEQKQRRLHASSDLFFYVEMFDSVMKYIPETILNNIKEMT